MHSPGELRGLVALVTGASGGLGEHFARTLARAGAAVALAARRTDRTARLAGELEASGARVLSVPLDVTSAASVQSCVGTVVATLGRVDILVNNAGVTVTRPVLEQTEADWDRVLDTNLKGAFLAATEVARSMVSAGHGGSIINVSSILGVRQGGSVTPYAVSKAGVIQLTKQMALELARYGIRVNCLAPGYLATDLNAGFLASEAGQRLLLRVPQRRFGRTEDLDPVLLMLASPAAGFVTGVTVPVDGGHLVSQL